MIAKFKYLLFVIVSLCYLQAAFKVNTGTIKNILGDEYDINILADNNVTQHILKVEHQPDFTLLSDFFQYQKTEIFKSFFVADFYSLFDTFPHKISLKKYSLLILCELTFLKSNCST